MNTNITTIPLTGVMGVGSNTLLNSTINFVKGRLMLEQIYKHMGQ